MRNINLRYVDEAYDENGLLKKGVLIRHLILPGQTDSAKDVIDYVAEHFEKGSVLFSLMAQYIPCGDAVRYPEINRRLTQEEYDTLTASAMAVADQYGCGVYVVTVDDMADYIDPDAVTETGETGMAAFTEYAWDALGLAASYDSNGIMLALSMAERDFQMLAHGDTANAAFTDYGKYIMQDEFLDNFREDDWYGGFADYIAACGRYLEANANGTPIDVEPSDETEEEYEPLSFGDKLFFAALMAFRFGLPLGLIVAFIVCAVYKRQLKSVRRATEAAHYTVSGGAEITAREDRFTHTTEVRTPIKTESDDHDSGPSFSGGTTVNSGGFSHSGGKF